MSSKFFNNSPENTLFDKFKGIAEGMPNFHSFLAVVGYFRSSGYFKLRKELANVQEIKILVGINVDSIFRKHNQALLMLEGDDEAREIYTKDFIQDVKDAKYSPEVEEGILQLCDDIVSGKLQMRIHKSKNLHAKFYLCLPQNFSPNTDGWVLMGSSNISDSGLGITQPPRYELNVAMKDYDDVAYCKNEFENLWSEGIPITAEDIERIRKMTHLEELPTPYEIFMKVLIDAFGNQVEDDFTLDMPKGYMQLKYQNDAVIQGFQMLKEYNGFFLADVVGTGKTIVAAMIAKRFVEENGKNTKILVIYPPAVKENWRDTIKDFSLTKYTQFVTNGSLNKVIEGSDNYDGPEEFDLVIVDEAHNFRSDTSGRYDDLQRICKTPRVNDGLVEGIQKKVMLLSATPLNNRPEDFRNLILLFQNARKPTLDGITNITTLFQPWIKKYNELMRKRGKVDNNVITDAADKIYEEMRTRVLDKILVRRTRKNLWNNEEYKADLMRQGIHFPNVEQPNECEYQLDKELSELFYDTITILTDTPNEDNPNGVGLHFARYRAIEYIIGEKAGKYRNAIQFAQVFSGIFRVHMVKRLESSFYAFKKSLHTFLRITNDMIKMWDNNNILIAPEIDVKGMMANDVEFDAIVEKALEHGYDKEDILFTQADFNPEYIKKLREDAEKLEKLSALWDKVEKDPKYDLFKLYLETELMCQKGHRNGKEVELNKEGKLVIFSESVDTINYLGDKLKNELHRSDVLIVSASNRRNVLDDIRANFDANYSGEKLNKYNIIISSDVLAEGVNLHRSNVIVNYDSPWNATRLMQRIGRVNRIGSTSDHIYNYMFYPSKDGDKQIQLYTNALIKLQGFHSALGEDAQVYSREEMLREFQLFDDKVRDNVDKQLELLREIRELYANNRELYNKIKALPFKSRTVRSAQYRPKDVEARSTIVYITTGSRSQFYKVTENEVPQQIEFLQAAEWLRAKVDEPTGNFEAVKELHYEHVRKAYKDYEQLTSVVETTEISIAEKKKDKNAISALAFLREMKRLFTADEIYGKIITIEQYVNDGVFSNLTLSLNRLSRELNRQKKSSTVDTLKPMLSMKLENFYDHYYISKEKQEREDQYQQSEIITSATFE
ncbi:MAG: helicase-related protein [Prevotella sp.]|nr:helicase-related protein [Prevotella sp.]